MGWTMLFLFLGLKIPLAALAWLVWWAIHNVDEPADPPAGGGPRRHHPHPPLPRHPRRGPHGDRAALSPPRSRRVTGRGRVAKR